MDGPVLFIVPGLTTSLRAGPGDSKRSAAARPYRVRFWPCGASSKCIFLKGTRGPNRYGADPLAPIDTRAPRWAQQDELQFVPHSAGPPAATHVKRGK